MARTIIIGFWPAFIYLYTIIPMMMFFCKVFYIYFLQVLDWEMRHTGSPHESPVCIKSVWSGIEVIWVFLSLSSF